MRLVVDKLPEHLQKLFKADALKSIPSPFRSPWFDLQERKRKGNRRDFISNVCGVPIGAADVPFDPEVLEEIRRTTIKPPDHEGEILFSYIDANERIDRESVRFLHKYGEKRLKWWGDLVRGRPNQTHNYIIGIDPSYGLGSANSATVIIDRNTGEQVGSWTDSTTKPEDFADMMVALAYWVGGVNSSFMIWESNAGCGVNFGARVVYQQYSHIYTQRREDSKTRKRTQKWGWQSNEKAKETLLGELGVALSSGLSKETDDTNIISLIIRDEFLLDELADYIFKEKGKGIIQSSKADLSTGAAERHGDRGIAAGLCVLACKEQAKGNFREVKSPPTNSFMHRYRQWEEEEERNKRDARQYLF